MPILPLVKILSLERIEELASRSNLRLGKQLNKDAEFKFLTKNIFRVVVEVTYKNKDKQKVELLSNHKGLRYSCSCSARKNNFCEHCIAVALNILPTT